MAHQSPGIVFQWAHPPEEPDSASSLKWYQSGETGGSRSQPPGRETHSEAQDGCREAGGVGGFLAMSGRLGHEEAHTQCPAI